MDETYCTMNELRRPSIGTSNAEREYNKVLDLEVAKRLLRDDGRDPTKSVRASQQNTNNNKKLGNIWNSKCDNI